MIELTLLKYIINNADEVVLTQLEERHFLDTQCKSYLKLIKEQKVLSDKIITEADLETLVKTPEIFLDIPTITDALVPFYIEQVRERYNKYNFFNSLYDTIQSDATFEETIDSVQNLLLQTGSQNQTILDIDCSELRDTTEDFILRKPLGFGKFDEINGGLGVSELCLLGGHRGSGKSVLALHSALSRFKLGDTVAFISIEMRYNEVGFRLDSMSTGLPIKDIQFNRLDITSLKQYYLRKSHVFCKDNKDREFLKAKTKNELITIYNSLEKKKNKFFLYDLPSCTLTDIAFIAQKLKKLHNLKYLVVDYLNIIKVPGTDDPIGWKTQIQRAEGLKSIARENDVAMFSPMQTDDEAKVKFARAIEDPVDLSLIFKKAKLGEEGSNKFKIFTSKIRNGTECEFSLFMNKENLEIHSELETLGNSKREITDARDTTSTTG